MGWMLPGYLLIGQLGVGSIGYNGSGSGETLTGGVTGLEIFPEDEAAPPDCPAPPEPTPLPIGLTEP